MSKMSEGEKVVCKSLEGMNEFLNNSLYFINTVDIDFSVNWINGQAQMGSFGFDVPLSDPENNSPSS